MLREGEQVSVRLTGGGPYGLRICAISDGPQRQLIVAKLHKKSKARAAGVRVGDVVLSINGNTCQGLSEETANHLIDYSFDLNIQLLRASDDYQIHPNLTSAFRHSPQPPSSLSPSPAPYHSGSESATLEHSTATELFRHQIHHHRHSPEPISGPGSIGQRSGHQPGSHAEPPTVKVTHYWDEEDSLPQQPSKSVRWSGMELEPGSADEASGTGSRTEQTDVKDGREDGFGWRKWIPPVSAGLDVVGDSSEHRESSLQQPKTSSTPAQSQPQPSFQPSQVLPNKSKPPRWQPPSSIDQTASIETAEVEPTALGLNTTTLHLDPLVHEVVIWSFKPTGVEQTDGVGQKPLPWQQPQQPGRKNEDATSSLASRQKPSRWQPSVQQKSGNLEGQEPGNAPKLPTWQPSHPTVAMETEKTPTWQPSHPAVAMETEKTPTWQPSQPTITMATEKRPTWEPPQPTVAMQTEKTPTWQPMSTQQPVDTLTSEQSQPRQHRWQPTQPPPAPPRGSQYIQPDQSVGQYNTLEEPKRQDGSSSPVVTSLFLTRVVTDGSAIVAGSGSDGESTHESLTTGNRKLYGDSSFYEDPEHTYPTIVEQIKMARKVALLLTSPANKNARGQRMFLKRKEQSTKWVADPLNFTAPYLFVSAPPLHSSPEEVDHSKILSPNEVERMRYYEEKSRHDVIPFDVCSMLAAELHEEKGRGGRLFAKRRHKVEESITSESNGFIRVPSPRPEQKPKFVPEVVKPLAAPLTRAERDEPDGAQPSVSVPFNRLKDMVDLPKARITPWDSAVQYGTVDPAFEHLQNYRPYAVEPSRAVAGPQGVLDHGGLQQGMFRQGQVQSGGRVQGHTSNQSYGFKREELVEDTRTAPYQSTFTQPQTKITGVAGFDGSSGIIRQASANRKGYRSVHFDVGARSFN